MEEMSDMALDDEVQNTSGRRGYHHTLISFFSFLLEALGSASSTFSTTALADFSSDFMVFNSDFKTFFDESDLVVSSESFSLDKLFFVVTDPPVVKLPLENSWDHHVHWGMKSSGSVVKQHSSWH